MSILSIDNFKNKYRENTFFLLGLGPTLESWDVGQLPKNSLTIGCNKIIKYKEPIDFLFIQDNGTIVKQPYSYHQNKEEYDLYQPNIAKFYGCREIDQAHCLKDKDVKDGNAIKYYLEDKKIEFYNHPFFEHRSVIFSMLQFAIYCGSKDIVLVGCDVTNNQRIGENFKHNAYKKENILGKWEQLVPYLKNNNISVKVRKPIGLKGIFEEYES